MRGASLTMLHQPTPRTDLTRWAEESLAVVKMIDAKVIAIADPFLPAAPILEQMDMRVSFIADLLRSPPTDPLPTDDDDLALLQLTSGSTGSPRPSRSRTPTSSPTPRR